MMATLSEMSQLAGARLEGADRGVSGVSIDTRTLAEGELFVALSGPNFDGHAFVEAAAARGASGVLVGRRVDTKLAQLVVDDPLTALQRAAAAWRARYRLPVVGVAGSNGKTTTKEMVAAILGQRYEVLATRGNLNNHIGVPLTLLRLRAGHSAAVIEMGANVRGDIRGLLPWVAPTVGIVTNAGAEHLEGFIDLDGVAAGEGELFEGLADDAVAVINADDAYADYWRSLSKAGSTRSFGLSPQADYRAVNIRASVGAVGFHQEFELVSPRGTVTVVLHLGGNHNVVNALGAAAAAAAAGAELEHIRDGLARVLPVKGRLELKAAGRARLIDDTYNANPSSLQAGLSLLGTFTGEKWLVLGDMGELGDLQRQLHVDAGRAARAAGVTRLFALGALTAHSVDAFGDGGEWFSTPAELSARVRPLLGDNVTLLVKGSRLNRLERVVDALMDAPGPAA